LYAGVEVIDFLLSYANVILFYTQVLKREMKPTQVHRIYLTKEQHLQGGDWLVKDQEAWDWLCGYWASDEFRVMSEQNQMNQ
jgi:hypothetical protein